MPIALRDMHYMVQVIVLHLLRNQSHIHQYPPFPTMISLMNPKSKYDCDSYNIFFADWQQQCCNLRGILAKERHFTD